MPSAREALLDSAYAALTTLPWTAVRMVDVAAAAGVSRQTLYNEFGSKGGLARALVRRAADGYLDGVERTLGTHLAEGGGPAELARWTVRAAHGDVLVKALITGVWGITCPGRTQPPPDGTAHPHRRRPPRCSPSSATGRWPCSGRAPRRATPCGWSCAARSRSGWPSPTRWCRRTPGLGRGSLRRTGQLQTDHTDDHQ